LFSFSLNLSFPVSNVESLFCCFFTYRTYAIEDLLKNLECSESFHNPHILTICLASLCFTLSLKVKASTNNSIFWSCTRKLPPNFIVTFERVKRKWKSMFLTPNYKTQVNCCLFTNVIVIQIIKILQIFSIKSQHLLICTDLFLFFNFSFYNND
jgi:hypothetical protein